MFHVEASYTRGDGTVVQLPCEFLTPPPGKTWRNAHVLLTKEGDGEISAVVLNLPGCASQGETIEDAMANVREALAGVLETYRECGEKVPWRNSHYDLIPPFSEQRYIQVECDKEPS